MKDKAEEPQEVEMTQIDEPNLNEQIESDLLDMWLLWERGNWYLNDDHPNYNKEHDRRFRDAIVEYITKLIANQVREARIDELELAVKNFKWGDGTDYLTDRIEALKGDDK